MGTETVLYTELPHIFEKKVIALIVMISSYSLGWQLCNWQRFQKVRSLNYSYKKDRGSKIEWKQKICCLNVKTNKSITEAPIR